MSLRFQRGLQSEPVMRRAHESSSGAGLLIYMRKGEPTTSLGLAKKAFKGRTPEARSCHTLLVCQTAHCRPATRSCAIDLRSHSPVLFARIQLANPFKEARTLESLPWTVFTVQCKLPGIGRILGHALSPQETKTVSWGPPFVGALGNLCQANLPSEGKPPLTAKSLSATTV